MHISTMYRLAMMMRRWWCAPANGHHRLAIMCVEFHSHLIKCIVFCWVVCVLAISLRQIASRSYCCSLSLAWCTIHVSQNRTRGILNLNHFSPAVLFARLSILFLFIIFRFESVKQCGAIYSNILKLLFVMTVQCSVFIHLICVFPSPLSQGLARSSVRARPPLPSKIMLFVEFGY